MQGRAGEVLQWVKRGDLKLRIEREPPLAVARAAHVAIEARRPTGKWLFLGTVVDSLSRIFRRHQVTAAASS